MDCQQVQNNLKAFRNGKLNLRTTRKMIEHINCCPKCYEELEIRLLVEKTVDVLSKDSPEDSCDFSHVLDDKLKELEKKVSRRIILLNILCVVILAFLLLGIVILVQSQKF